MLLYVGGSFWSQLGAKSKLGAQKVKTNFADIESAAHQADLMKKETSIRQKKTKEEETTSMYVSTSQHILDIRFDQMFSLN